MYLPGLYCSLLLADLGAEVIHVSAPTERVDKTAQMQMPLNLNRNKKSLVLDLKTSEGKEILRRLLIRSDILIEHFRPVTAERLGVSYSATKEVNPGIIHCSITGYGHDGPYRDRVGHDINYIALAGILGLTGDKEGPPVIPGIPIADLASAMFSALSILSALLYKQKTGKGQFVDVAMFDGMVSWLTFLAASHFAGGAIHRGELLLAGYWPWYNVYKTKDGEYLSIGAMEKKFWDNLCQKLDRPEWKPHQYDKERRQEIRSELERIFLSKTRDEWMAFWGNEEICCEPVLSLNEVFLHPQVVHRRMIQECFHPALKKMVKQLGIPIKFGDAPVQVKSPGPLPGQNTEEILRELKVSEEEINLLKSKKVIGITGSQK
jgi:crotonobetainyl-CoA:carnitine CoA-transferase CaiB-like acyl-CoA transferase